MLGRHRASGISAGTLDRHAATYHRTMSFIQLTRDTGTVCKNGHPQSIREDYLRAHDGDHLTAQRGPTCWIAGCEAHTEYLHSEQKPR